jgi:purine-binding chemotaxis protein CheW
MAQPEPNESTRIIVLRQKTLSVGLTVDQMSEVLRISRADTEALPPLLSREQGMADISDLCSLEGGKRLVAIIAPEKLFAAEVVQQAISSVGNESTEERHVSNEVDDDLNQDEEQLVVFRLHNEEFAVPIAYVQEIVRIPEELTYVPKAPDYVEGVINLRGTVLPVIDQRRRMGLPATKRDDRQRIMVYMLENFRMGFIVDAVSEVLMLDNRAIEKAPRLSAGQAEIITRVANLPEKKRMIQMIDPGRLVGVEEMNQVAAAVGQEG